MKIITPDTVTFCARITEDELRERLTLEALESINALDETGKPLKDVKTKVTRGTGRVGGYKIEITGPAPARLLIAKA